MRTLASSKWNPEASNKLQCAIRKIAVEATPEERVRQDLLRRMVDGLGYPPGLIAVEVELRRLPHLQLVSQEIPVRRADIVCFGKGIHPRYELYPLLLIECKATKLTTKTINQVVGYNHHVCAHFVAIANAEEVRTGWYDAPSNTTRFVEFLPPFQQLRSAVPPQSAGNS